MSDKVNLECKTIYKKTNRLLTVHFNKEIKMDDIPIEEVTKSGLKDEYEDYFFDDDEINRQRQMDRLENLLLEIDGVNSVEEIKKYSVAVEVGFFSDFLEVKRRVIDIIECLVFSGEEARIISRESKNNKKAKKTQNSTKSQK